MFMSEVSGTARTVQVGRLSGCRIVLAGSVGPVAEAVREALVEGGAHVADGTSLVADQGSKPGADGLYRSMLTITQRAIAELGGIDGVVSIVELDRDGLADAVLTDGIESCAHSVLAGPLAVLRVALNRMETTWIEGGLVAVLVIPDRLRAGEALVASVIRSMLTDIVRNEAGRAAELGISVAAVIVDGAAGATIDDAVSTTLRALSADAGRLNGMALLVDSCC